MGASNGIGLFILLRFFSRSGVLHKDDSRRSKSKRLSTFPDIYVTVKPVPSEAARSYFCVSVRLPVSAVFYCICLPASWTIRPAVADRMERPQKAHHKASSGSKAAKKDAAHGVDRSSAKGFNPKVSLSEDARWAC